MPESQTEIRTEKNIYEWFWWSVILKGAISIIEMLAGVIVFLLPHNIILSLVNGLLKSEVAENPFVASHILSLAQGFTGTIQIFVAFYLFSRGIIKLGLVYALLKNKLWAYPVSLVVLGLFVIYQTYQIVTSHSIIIVGITLFDLVVIYFVWREYQIVRRHLNTR